MESRLKKKGSRKSILLVLVIALSLFAASCGSEGDEKGTNNVSDNSESKEKDTTKKDDDKESDESEETDTTVAEDDDTTAESDDTQAAGEESETKNEAGGSTTEAQGNANEGETGSVNGGGANPETTKAEGQKDTTSSQPTTEKSTQAEIPVVNTGKAITGRVSVHDPSIVVGTDKAGKKCYYIFGSHMAWAKSYDLQNWTVFKNNINDDFKNIFADAYKWSSNGDSVYQPNGNLWAPDVIYNTAMKKWCMYMSVNGCSWNSVIVLLTADSLEGDWTYVGPVVYSGFTASGTYDYTQTDYVKATGDTDFSNSGRYYKNAYQCKDGNTKCEATTWNNSTGAHAIDPCVKYDKNGNLYMAYGSWSGGIWMIELDENTGLRDYSVQYAESDLTNAVTDPYMGKKISGATGAQGEGAYIVYDASTDYYYLYVSYGWLGVNGGYQIRTFRSKNIDGTYEDWDGTRANARGGNRDGIGIKLMGNYYFSSLSTNNANAQKGYKSPGHNSAFIDSDGSHYLIYHTRFNLGNEWHAVRVHQQFMNEDGWLVTAVYENLGSKISETGYSMDDMAGDYELVNMGTNSATQNVDMLTTDKVTLKADGTVTGSYSGTWSYKNQYVTMTLGGKTYKGVFFKQFDESSEHKEVMTFTLVGNDTSVWATK